LKVEFQTPTVRGLDEGSRGTHGSQPGCRHAAAGLEVAPFGVTTIDSRDGQEWNRIRPNQFIDCDQLHALLERLRDQDAVESATARMRS
jgi:hypothetical protein